MLRTVNRGSTPADLNDTAPQSLRLLRIAPTPQPLWFCTTTDVVLFDLPTVKFKVQPLTTMANRVLRETRQFHFKRKATLNRSHVSLLCFPNVTRLCRRRTFPLPGGRSRGTKSASTARTLVWSSAPTSAQMSETTPSRLVPDVV